MEPLAFVIAILGCGDAGTACERVRVEPVSYVTQSACLAAVQARLAQNTDLPYPEIVARCETRGWRVASR